MDNILQLYAQFSKTSEFKAHDHTDFEPIYDNETAKQLLSVGLHVHNDRWAEALSIIEDVRSKYPQPTRLTLLHVAILTGLGENERALHILSEREGSARNASVLKLLGYMRLQNKELASALDLFRQSVALDRSDVFAQINLHFMRQLQAKALADHKPEAARPGIALATSIPPVGFERSKAAVDSWLGHGFRVISVNSEQEMRILRKEFPGVEFVAVARTGRDVFGKDYIHLDSILEVLAETGAPICGIINSDIILGGKADLSAVLGRYAARAFVYGSRLDVKTPDAGTGRVYESGFDFFFFPRALAAERVSSAFCLGLPWWDYFLPFMAHIRGYRLHRIFTPIALHVFHETQWSARNNHLLGMHFVQFVQPMFSSLLQSVQGIKPQDGSKLLGGLSRAIIGFLGKASSPILINSPYYNKVFAIPDPKESIIPYGATVLSLELANAHLD